MKTSRFLSSIAALLLSGCAATIHESSTNLATKYLKGSCLQTFYGGHSMIMELQYGVFLRQPLNQILTPVGLGPKGYFAVAISADGRIVCGWRTNGQSTADIGLSYEKLAEEALARCEVKRREEKINEPCALFARDMEVIYEKNSSIQRSF